MKPDLSDLTKILKPFVDAEVGETGDYPELDETLRKVVSWKVLVEAELREMSKEKGVTTNLGILYNKDPIKEILGE